MDVNSICASLFNLQKRLGCFLQNLRQLETNELVNWLIQVYPDSTFLLCGLALGLYIPYIILHIVKDVVVVFREAFHPSIRPVIHPWMASYREENPGRNNSPPPPPLRMCRYLGKACPDRGGGTPKILISISTTNPTYICCLRSFPMVSSMLLSHGSQTVQISRFSAARVPLDTCEMWYIERFWKCSL